MAKLMITSKREGFRRGGIAHSATETIYDEDQFSEEQLEQILNEPMLVVNIVDEDELGEVEQKALADAESDEPEGEDEDRPESHDELMAAIVAIIDDMDEVDDFTKDGSPRVAVVENKLGYGVTGDEVAEAFEQYQKAKEAK